MEGFEVWSFREDQLRHREDRRGGEHQRRLSVGDDGLQPGQSALELGWVGRVSGDGHHPCVQAAEKTFDEVQPRRVEEERPPARRPRESERGGDCQSAPLQLPVGQMKLARLSVEQKGIGQLVRLAECPPT